jgi:hypothetical protein
LIDLQTIGVLVAAASVVVGVNYNIYSLHLQTRNRQAQIYMTIWQKMNSKEWQDAANLWFVNRDINDYEHFMELYHSSEEMERGMGMEQEVFEGIGVFVHEGLVDIRLVAREMGGYMPRWWRWYGPFLLKQREELRFPRFMIEAEYLYNRLIDFGRRHPEFQIPLE